MFAFRRSARSVALAVVMTMGVPIAALAADTSQDKKMPKSYAALVKMKPAAVMKMMDEGGKGYVTKEEFMKFQDQLFERMDKDKDGRATQTEWMDIGTGG